MKNVKFTFITIILILSLYQIPQLIEWFFNHSIFNNIQINQNLVEGIFDAFGIFVILIFFMSISYKKKWDAQTFKRVSSAIGFAVIFIFSFFLFKEIYRGFRAIDKLYAYYKDDVGIAGNVFTADDTLGHKGVPNGFGYNRYPLKNNPISVPIQLDTNGFRVPAKKQTSDTLMLFLGCSFTWGDYVLAEENYPSITTNLLNYKSINCGTDAYGLAQMLILAKREIPKHKPKFLSIQYSPWLADRARFMFFPSAHGVMPFPFITTNNGKDLYIEKPFFNSALYNPAFQKFKSTPSSFLDKFSFFLNVGYPVSILDYWKQKIIMWKMYWGVLPIAVTDNSQIERFVYEQIFKICQQYGVKMLVLNIGGFGYSDEQRMKNHYDRKHFQSTMSKELQENVVFIDSDSVLRANIGPHENYSKYIHWGKISEKDSMIFDNHPNQMTHKIIAENLVKAVRQ